MKKLQELFNRFLSSKKTFWIVLGLFFVIVRLATWLYPYDSDHWIFYYVGKTIAQGGLLYVNAWDHKPPLIFEFNALMHILFGGSLVLHRIFLTALAILDILLFYKLSSIFSKNFFKNNAEKITRISLILYVFWRNLSQFTSSGNNTENIGLIFLMLMFIAFLKFYSFSSSRAQRSEVEGSLKESKNKRFLHSLSRSVGRNDNSKYIYLFLSGSGVCLSILFYLKPNFSLLSLPILVEIFILSYKSIKRFVTNYLIFGLPFLLQTAFWVIYFNANHALKDFWIASFAFSSAYAKSTWGGNVSPQTIFILIILPFFLPLTIFAINFFKDFKNVKSDMLYRFLLVAFIASLTIALGLGSFYPYYFLISMPIFVLIFAYSGNKFLQFSKKKNLIIVLVLLGGMAVSFAMSNKELLNSFRGPAKAELNEYQQIADYIKVNSGPNDKIEAYTYGAVLYRMAERDAGSRYISASVLLLDTRDNYGFNLDDKFIGDMEKSKAKYWIIAKDSDNIYYQNKKIILYMLNNYRIEKEFDNYMVLKRK